MRTFNYILTTTQGTKVNTSLLDVEVFMQTTKTTHSHYWDGMIVTAVEEKDVEEVKNVIDNYGICSVLEVAQSVDQYKAFAKKNYQFKARR